MKKPSFHKTPLATGVALALGATALSPTSAIAQDSGEAIEEIVTIGIRKSQMDAVLTKRDSESIIDGISASDLGKLPDVTVADSLQRIPGVQIQRSAGEGDTVNIRGLPQIRTLLNGEQFLTSGNIGEAQPSLADIPSQLVNGIDVFKSANLKNKRSGLTGTIDIKTWRPLDFDEGFTTQIAAEYANGEDTSEGDVSINGLINWSSGNVGVLIAAVTSEANLGNNYAGIGGSYFCNDWCGGDPTWMAPHGYESHNRVLERERDGINAALQVDFDNGFSVTAETFYTEMEEHDHKVGLNISNRWSTPNWLTPTEFTETGVGNNIYSVTEYDVDAYWVNSFTVNRTRISESQHHNLELKYDADNWSVKARFIDDSADFLSTNGQSQGDLSNWRGTQFFSGGSGADENFPVVAFYPASVCSQYDPSRVTVVGDEGGCFIDPNPQGYGEDPLLHRDTSSGKVVWSGFDTPISGGLGAGATLADYMANVDSYAIGAFSSEGNQENTGDNQIFSLDGEYFFDDAVGGFITEVRGGVRSSSREATILNFHLFSDRYAGEGAADPEGCAVQWKAIDVNMDNAQCTAGETIGGEFRGYTVNPPTRIDDFNNVIFVTDYGSRTSGMPGVWAADPKDYDDVAAFHNRVFGNANRVSVPGNSYDVELEELSYFVDMSLQFSDTVSGTFGVRYVDTEISVRQNEVGDTQAYGDTNLDIGDFFTKNSYDDLLPALNLAYRPTDNWTFRFSYSKNMMAHDLGSYGGALDVDTAPCSTAYPEDVAAAGGSIAGDRCFNGGAEGGNPFLDPWRTDNYDLSAEYYYGSASMFFLGVFRLDIESFTAEGTRFASLPDSDGVVRRELPISTTILGEGGTIEGIELGAKLDFADYTDGFFRNFGLDANYTYAPSDSNDKDLAGNDIPFPDNSEQQYNLVGWFQSDQWQARLAWNWRSERFREGLTAGVNGYQDSIGYLDAQVTYDVTEDVSVYVNGSNITGEIEEYYVDFGAGANQYWENNEFEARYTIGVRARFD